MTSPRSSPHPIARFAGFILACSVSVGLSPSHCPPEVKIEFSVPTVLVNPFGMDRPKISEKLYPAEVVSGRQVMFLYVEK
jgi:hypothetical protein